MCLTTTMKRGLTAKKDIKVYKQLLCVGGDNYRTPYQGSLVTLNATLSPSEKTNVKFKEDCATNISKGFIHAYALPTFDDDNTCFEAIIPKGTEYFISSDFKEICARGLYITNKKIKKVKNKDKAIFNADLLEECLSEFTHFEKDKVSVGDVVYSDLTTKHITEVEDYKDIIGVVSLIEDGRVLVCSLKEKSLKWSVYGLHKVLSEQITISSDALKDKSGRKYFDEIVNNEEINIHSYPAFEHCKEYGVGGQDWYLGSIGEMFRIVRDNAILINITLKTLLQNGVDADNLEGWYWASAESSSADAWLVNTYYATVSTWSIKWGSLCVRPVFAIEQA